MGNIGFKLYVNKILGRGFGKKINEKLATFRVMLRDFEGREHYKKFGDLNPDKQIYLIRREFSEGEGLLSVFTYIMGRIDFADRNGMIPFVDVDKPDVPSMFSKYFVQKGNLSKEEVHNSKNVLLSGYGCKPVYPGWCNWINTEFNEQKRELFDKYLDFTQEVKDAVNKELEFINPQKCLGLYLRGTAYLHLKPAGHPVQPHFEDVQQEVDRILEEEKLDKIFLVTEDINLAEQVKAVYGERVVTVHDDKYFAKTKDYVSDEFFKSESIDINNMRYLVKIILLSQCHSFVGGRTNGSSVACAFNGGKYVQRYVYDVGYY